VSESQDWILLSVAAAMLGYSTDYFRRSFCNPERPLIRIRVIKGPKGKGGRRILVWRPAVEALLLDQIHEPA
jgi:hypothetical protein